MGRRTTASAARRPGRAVRGMHTDLKKNPESYRAQRQDRLRRMPHPGDGTCFNCHIDSRLAGVQDASIKREGLTFLINHDGRVKLGNLLTYVYKNGTAITRGAHLPHKISSQGRTCAECHGTRIAKEVAAGTLVLTRFRKR